MEIPGRTSPAAAGFVVGAAGVAVLAVSGADRPRPAAGVVVLLVAAVLTVTVRKRWWTVGGAAVAVLALLNVVDPGRPRALLGADGAGIAIGTWMLALGALTALAALSVGVLSAGAGRRARSRAVAPESPWPRRAQVAGLLVLAPVCAEYLAAYDDSTGDALRLVGGLIIFVPLYGAPALLIREVCRRAGLGWTGIVLLAAVFGLIEAGLVDQSLFSLDYRQIASWDATLRGTFLAPLGLSAYNVLNFIGGHVIYSICAPIALVEAFRPGRHREPWVSRPALGVVAVLYGAASVLVLGDHLATEDSHASAGQLLGTVVVIALLALGAVVLGRRPSAVLDRAAPGVRSVAALALAVALVEHLAGTSWAGFAVAASALVVGGALGHRAARSRGWGPQHVVAVAAAFLLTRAVLAFTYFPLIGDVSALRKYGHNVVLLVAVLAVSLLAARATARDAASAPAGRSAPVRIDADVDAP